MQPMISCTKPPLPLQIASDGRAELAHMDLAALVKRCVNEREQFRHTKEHDTRFGFELFRRAIVEANQEAWEQIYIHYRGLVECWVRRCSAFAHTEESSESFTLAAFARFARVIKPERFAAFPNLATLLRYLRRCTESVVLDSLRAHRSTDALPEETVLDESGLIQGTDDRTLERVERQEFWSTVMGLLNDEAERVVVLRTFVLGMRPSDIYDNRRDLFTSIADVYSIKRNVLIRLRRNGQIQQMLGSNDSPASPPTPTLPTAPTINPIHQQIGAVALEQILQRESSDTPISVPIHLRHTCGRWIAMRRLELGITNDVITSSTGIDEQTLLLLETGIADIHRVNSETQARLIGILEGNEHTLFWVADIVTLALGIRVADIDRVLIELQAKFAHQESETSNTRIYAKLEPGVYHKVGQHLLKFSSRSCLEPLTTQ